MPMRAPPPPPVISTAVSAFRRRASGHLLQRPGPTTMFLANPGRIESMSGERQGYCGGAARVSPNNGGLAIGAKALRSFLVLGPFIPPCTSAHPPRGHPAQPPQVLLCPPPKVQPRLSPVLLS